MINFLQKNSGKIATLIIVLFFSYLGYSLYNAPVEGFNEKFIYLMKEYGYIILFAWSILEGQMIFFFIITVIAVTVITYLLIKYRNEHWLFLLGLSFVLAGAIGNFIDRMRLGYVIDMFQTEFITFPIFNVADATLFIGVVGIFIYTIFEEKLKGTQHGKAN